MPNIMPPTEEIELLIRRYYEMRSRRIGMWRKARTSFRLKYFTAELISVDQRGWEEFMDFESQNSWRIEKVQVDGQEAEVVVTQPSMGAGEIGWIYYLRNTEYGWRIARRKVQ